MQRERHSLSGEDSSPRKAKFEITRGLERKSLAMNQGLGVDRLLKVAGSDAFPVDKLMSFQLPEKNLQTQRS